MRLTDKTLTCQHCSGSFVFTAAEQEMLVVRARSEEPSRCPPCSRRVGAGHGRREVPPAYVKAMVEP